MHRVALVTSTGSRPLDEDLPLLARALERLGVSTSTPAWDDAAVDWTAADLVIVRSTWDYTRRRERFLAWAEEVASLTTLRNPAPVLRWNTDKQYLADLAAAGVPVVPTTFATSRAQVELPAGPEVVVKPSVSAGSRDTARYRTGDPARRAAAVAHATRIVDAGGTAMIQPYLDRIDAAGETAIVVVAGTLSHTLVKRPLLEPDGDPRQGSFAPEHLSARAPTADELATAHAALAVCRDLFGAAPLLYARVDLIPDHDGAPCVLELELTEPSLFHAHAPGSAERFAQAIVAELEG